MTRFEVGRRARRWPSTSGSRTATSSWRGRAGALACRRRVTAEPEVAARVWARSRDLFGVSPRLARRPRRSSRGRAASPRASAAALRQELVAAAAVDGKTTAPALTLIGCHRPARPVRGRVAHSAAPAISPPPPGAIRPNSSAPSRPTVSTSRTWSASVATRTWRRTSSPASAPARLVERGQAVDVEQSDAQLRLLARRAGDLELEHALERRPGWRGRSARRCWPAGRSSRPSRSARSRGVPGGWRPRDRSASAVSVFSGRRQSGAAPTKAASSTPSASSPPASSAAISGSATTARHSAVLARTARAASASRGHRACARGRHGRPARPDRRPRSVPRPVEHAGVEAGLRRRHERRCATGSNR